MENKLVEESDSPRSFSFLIVSPYVSLLSNGILGRDKHHITTVTDAPRQSLRPSRKQHSIQLQHSRIYTDIEKYMAQSLHIGLYGLSTNLPFCICAIYFDLKVNVTLPPTMNEDVISY